MRTQKSREGYVMIDHRASPGLPADVARAQGLDPGLVGEGKLFECASLTCKHCKCSVVKNPLRTRARPHCYECDHYICDLCHFETTLPGYVHAPYEKKVDDAMRQAALGSPRKLLTP